MIRKATSSLAAFLAATAIAASAQEVEIVEPCQLHSTITYNTEAGNPNPESFSMRARIDSVTYSLAREHAFIDNSSGKLLIGDTASVVSSLPLYNTTLDFSQDSVYVTHRGVPAPFTKQVSLRMSPISRSRGFAGRVLGRVSQETLDAHRSLQESLSHRSSGWYALPCRKTLELHNEYSDGETQEIMVRFENGG